MKNALQAAELLHEHGVEATVLRLLTLEPLPVEEVISHLSENRHVVIMEEVCQSSGIGDAISCALYSRVPNCRIERLDLGKQYITHGSISALHSCYKLDGKSVAEHILEVRSCEN